MVVSPSNLILPVIYFIQQIFMEHLQCARYCERHRRSNRPHRSHPYLQSLQPNDNNGNNTVCHKYCCCLQSIRHPFFLPARAPTWSNTIPSSKLWAWFIQGSPAFVLEMDIRTNSYRIKCQRKPAGGFGKSFLSLKRELQGETVSLLPRSIAVSAGNAWICKAILAQAEDKAGTQDGITGRQKEPELLKTPQRLWAHQPWSLILPLNLLL